MIYTKLNRLAAILSACLMLAACGTPKEISYFQDLSAGDAASMLPESQIRLRPEDKISIIVNTSNPEITRLFNLPYTTNRLGFVADASTGYSPGISGYTLDANGDVDFPVLGPLHVGGMRREEAAAYIKDRLLSSGMTRDAIVTVEFMNLSVAVMGEVNRPGRYNIMRDNFTIFDAISSAGDLTIRGKRDGVIVLREEDGVQRKYVVNLCSAREVLSSPVFYLQQNDMVYVEPNDVRARESTVNGNNVRSTSFWISIASLVSTIALYFLR